MKTQVLEVLRDTSLPAHKKYNSLMELMRQSPEVNVVSMKRYNQAGATKETIDLISYDLQKIYGIKDVELRAGYKLPKKAVEKEVTPPVDEALNAELLDFDIENANYHKELKPFALRLAEDRKADLPDAKTETLKDFIYAEAEKLKLPEAPVFENPFVDAPEEARNGLKLREEFPFLSLPETPIKLKGLVADKITAFHAVIDARSELFPDVDADGNDIVGSGPNEERALELCKTAVENFELNQLIYDELNYYKEHKELLGKHPVFADEMLQREVDEMSDNDAHTAIRTIGTYISKEKKGLEAAKTPESKAVIQEVIAGHKTKISLLKNKLGIEQ